MKNVKNKKMMAVVLPEGCFYGNCSDCVYADRSDWRDGEVYCLCEKGWTHGYNRPSDRNGCAYYEGTLITKKGRKNYDGCIVHVCPLGMGRMDLVEGH